MERDTAAWRGRPWLTRYVNLAKKSFVETCSRACSKQIYYRAADSVLVHSTLHSERECLKGK